MTECGQCGGAAAAAAAPLYTDTIISLTEFLRLPSVQCPGVHHYHTRLWFHSQMKCLDHFKYFSVHTQFLHSSRKESPSHKCHPMFGG